MSVDTLGLTAERCVELLDGGEISCRELVEAYLDRIEAADGSLNCFLRTRRELALSEAEALDRSGRSGLQGVPIALKDILCVRGEETTAGSRILEGHRPLFDAGVVTRAREAGLIPLGKTNMDEFAMGSSTEHSAFGATHNPWDASLVPGGSSGGSAAAVAAGFAPLSLGTDTGGSRSPATPSSRCTGAHARAASAPRSSAGSCWAPTCSRRAITTPTTAPLSACAR